MAHEAPYRQGVDAPRIFEPHRVAHPTNHFASALPFYLMAKLLGFPLH